MFNLLDRGTGFMGCSEDYNNSDIVLVGAPMDFTVSFRPGTRQGPQAVRQVSIGLEEYSVMLDRDLANYRYYDAGDISLPFGHVAESLNRIGQVTAHILKDGKFPLVLGGEHLISLPVIEQVAAKYPGLKILHFDAHADLREEYMGQPYSHASVIRRVASLVGGKNIYQFGIRSGTRDEFAYARDNTNMFVGQILAPLKKVLPELQGWPVHITIDIDVVDPAFAPGTGTPEPGGCSAAEILEAIYLMKQLNVVGFDLVEISPVYDQSERTAILGAKLVREAILAFGKNNVK
ncbi:agmatinase [Desulfotomaculum nigrificans CO-1-SRB]|uniref:Agmatinase n=1 Tax=Desulfotomaculum nigrificans (strain DSM 14880 / VKM B-2319 / CO-1-SRB) TaxID=868595 RepID=F6B477_DESCC|nr:agmatinase [Desulfotomaculum nigrificans]AEF95254.1 agmatinase [Desulfotomaculum nigrificans CO-1-SRB]